MKQPKEQMMEEKTIPVPAESRDSVPAQRPDNCECDNGHEQAETCCMPCWTAGFRTVAPSER